MNDQRFNKLYTALKYLLIGKNYTLGLKALMFAKKYHQGTRKDGKTPEFQHQLEICHYLITLNNIRNLELVLACALLHDVAEDYNIEKETLDQEFGKEVRDIVLTLSKVYQGVKKTPESYFKEIASCPIASIVKGGDRIHNLQSMPEVFSKEKQQKYIQEVETYFLPMIKNASYNFPDQMLAYLNIKHLLKSQMYLIKLNISNLKD